MSPEHRKTTARRLVLSSARRGAIWILALDGKSFAIGAFWMPLKLRRTVYDLRVEILEFLRERAAQQAKEEKLLMPEAESRSARLTVN